MSRLFLKRSFHKSIKLCERGDFEDPILRTARVLSDDVKNFFKKVKRPQNRIIEGIPTYTDIVVIGGGAIGSSIAYWLKEKSNDNSFEVVVLEKDMSVSIVLLISVQYNITLILVHRMFDMFISGWFEAAIFASGKHSNVPLRSGIHSNSEKTLWAFGGR